MKRQNPDAWGFRTKADHANFVPCETVLESGPYRYRYLYDWAEIPEDLRTCRCRGVCCAEDGTVYALFDDARLPVAAFGADGRFLEAFGGALGLTFPHGIDVSGDRLLLTDSGTSAVYVTNRKGTLLSVIGTPGVPADTGFDERMAKGYIAYLTGYRLSEGMNRPTQALFAADGTVLISDGYGNAALHRYTAEGKHIWTAGGLGREPGELMLPHGLSEDRSGRIWVCDRENDRVQIFDAEGAVLGEIPGLLNPCGIFLSGTEAYIAESDRRVSIYRIREEAADQPHGMPELTLEGQLGYLASPFRFHALTGNQHGNLYASEFSDFQLVKLERIL